VGVLAKKQEINKIQNKLFIKKVEFLKVALATNATMTYKLDIDISIKKVLTEILKENLKNKMLICMNYINYIKDILIITNRLNVQK
jgi:hypothetical protein